MIAQADAEASATNLIAFPRDRIVRRPEPSPSAITLIQGDDEISYDTSEAFWAAVREADPELQRRLADAGMACDRAAALSTRASAVLARAEKRRQDLRQVGRILQIVALAGAAAGAVAFGLRP